MPLQPGTRLRPYEVQSLIGHRGHRQGVIEAAHALGPPGSLEAVAPELANDRSGRSASYCGGVGGFGGLGAGGGVGGGSLLLKMSWVIFHSPPMFLRTQT